MSLKQARAAVPELDKTGGVTEALRLAHAAQAANFKSMVGCLAGSSLGMAPAFVLGQIP